MNTATIWIVVAVVALVIIGGLIYFANRAPAPVGGNEPTSAPAAPNSGQTSANPSNSRVKEFTVTGQNFSFTPDTLAVKKGDTVKINFENTGGYPHSFVIDEFNVRTPQIAVGQTSTVTFTADKEGTYEYYYSVDGHRENGMLGTLTVTP